MLVAEKDAVTAHKVKATKAILAINILYPPFILVFASTRPQAVPMIDVKLEC
jgi:hypothetical protein